MAAFFEKFAFMKCIHEAIFGKSNEVKGCYCCGGR